MHFEAYNFFSLVQATVGTLGRGSDTAEVRCLKTFMSTKECQRGEEEARDVKR
jgi:hypothetical protein